jgi:S1-C subfamily serine protease
MRKTLVISCLLSAFAAQGLAQTQTTSSQVIPKLVASARGTVVLLKTFDRHGRVLALGSGFRVSGGRYVTNAHVVEGASRVEIFDDAGALLGIARSADMLSTTVDLAVLPSVGPRSPYLSLAGAPPLVGEQVIVIGAPEGLTNTVSDGIVSAVRKIESRHLLQITAPISPGSSGGPVLNTLGQVVGVSVSILREGQNLNFAVPVSDVVALVASRAGQFEFPASTEEASQSSPRTGKSTPPTMVRVGSRVEAQLSPEDIATSEGYVDYYRLKGATRTSISISAASADFDPFIAVYELVGDSLAVVGSYEESARGTIATANLTLSPGTNYTIAVGVADDSHSGLGRYVLHVETSARPAEPSPSRTSDSEDRWVSAGHTKEFVNEFDRTRITRSGSGTYLVWERVTYQARHTNSEGLTYDGMMTQFDISCLTPRFRVISIAKYLEGSVVWSDYEARQWRAAIPETVAEFSGAIVCKYVKANGL